MDPYRLPRTAVPSRYDLRLEPDLTTLTFRGQETVALEVTESISELVLNAIELAIDSASLENDRGETIRATATMDEATERCRLALASPAARGRWRLRLAFRGTLNDKLRGFYRSVYKDPSGVSRTMAATQFEATDARRAFPCWDEPSFKAVFAVTLAIDPELTAVSNTSIVGETLENGRKIVRFADSIVMSTYLVAFVVGELEHTDPTYVGRVPLSVWCVPGKKRLARFGQEIGAASLAFFEDYYGLPYPGDKLDLLSIPDFAAGAMENFGAITFRETALLVDETAASHAELERVADVVAHENAHMWFGDLVTMTWWNGIWLNEAFATFMEMLAVDAWKPEWQRWSTFGVSRAAALSLDGLHSTRPIEFPVTSPRDADAMFDVLTYEKGASVLRMLEQYLGAVLFREGVRDYLRTHKFGNADTGDLWAALGRSARQPIPAVMDGWIFRPGYPVVTVTRDAGGQLVLAQQRFNYLREPLPPAVAEPEQPWQVPIQLRVYAGSQAAEERVLLAEREARLRVGTGVEAVVANAGGHGFYRVRYAPDLLDALLRRLDALAPIERFNLVNDAWALAVAGLMPLTAYLDLTARFREERDRNVWSVLASSFYALNRLVEPGDRRRLEALVRDRATPVFTALGWTPRPGEDELTRQLRGDLVRLLGVLGNDPGVQARAAEAYRAYLADPTAVDPNVLPAVIAVLAHVGDAARYEDFLKRFRAAATPQEEQRYLYALAGFRDSALAGQTLERAINGEIRTQDAPFVVRGMLMSVHAREAAWEFVKAHWDTMDRLYPKHGLRRLAEGVTGLATPALEADVRRFFAEKKPQFGGKVLAQYLEQLHVAVVLREREGGALSGYLSKFA
ncbi:MAG TPA: M1 family metallopeptidase [Patescibacteria group bacterium]|nr:M1 family metallopeptidase [Patescibacteria group bacterium]